MQLLHGILSLLCEYNHLETTFKKFIMAKSKDLKKNVKKEPMKTAKEKKAEKRAKKAKQ